MARTYGNNASRGYGTLHWKLRAQWKPLVESGQVQCHAIICLEELDGCARWITPGTPWHLGHTEDRSGWTGPEHRRCGASDGARRGNQDRPRHIEAATPGRDIVCKICGQPYHYAARQCPICGRHYHPNRGVQYTCSRPCGVQYKRLTYGNGSGRASAPKPACAACGKPCPGYSRTCSQECAEKLRYRELTCERCGKGFTGGSARFCSATCRSLAYYQENRRKIIDRQLAAYYARQGREPPARQPHVTVPLQRQRAVKQDGSACVLCGKTVWRSTVNQVGDGWACAPCRRRMPVAPSRAW